MKNIPFWQILGCWVFLCSIYSTAHGQNLRRIQRQWENENWSALKTELDEGLNRDEPAPEIKYYYSRWYTHQHGKLPSTDSALYWIRAAQRDWAITDDRTKNRLERFEITESALRMQKVHVDSLAFAMAIRSNSEAAFRRFVVNHFDAPQLDDATDKMYERGFAEAKAANTYAAFRDFWTDHPEAPQVAEARSLAQIAAYEAETSENTKEGYARFLRKYPDSPFRTRAEENLLRLTTLTFSAEEFTSFLAQYPNSKLRTRVVGMLYHLSAEAGRAKELLAAHTQWPEWDSLVSTLPLEEGHLYPIWADTSYRMWNPATRKFIPKTYRNLPDTICETGWSHAWLPLRPQDQGAFHIVTRAGARVFGQMLDDAKDLGGGFVGVMRGGQWGVWHLAGFEVLPIAFQDVSRIDQRFLAGKKNGVWEFFTPLGKAMDMPQIHSFQEMAPYFLLEYDGYWGVTLLSKLLDAARGVKPSVDFAWEEVERLDSDELMLFVGDREAVMNTRAELVVPPGEWTLEDVGFGWLAESDAGFGLVLHGTRGLSPPFYADVQYTRGWLALKQNDAWALLHPAQGFRPEFSYDSVRVLGSDVLYVAQDDRQYLQLGDTLQLPLSGEHTFRVLPVPAGAEGHDWVYLTYEDSAKLWEATGRLLWQGNSEVLLSRVGPHHFRWETAKGQGVGSDLHGLVTEAMYEGIGQAQETFVPLLADGVFGVYWTEADTVSAPQWDRLPSPYSDRTIIGTVDDRQGVYSASGETLIAPRFEEIRYWNDTVALCRNGYVWETVSLRRDSVVGEPWLQVTPLPRDEYLINTEAGFGLVHPLRGLLIAPGLESLEWIGDGTTGFWRGENYVPAAGWYIYTYFDRYGRRIHRQTVDEQLTDRVFCE